MIPTKIACCVPFHQDVTLRWALDLRRLQIPCDHLWIITSHYELDQSREELAKDALESGATHALFIDTDVRVPTDGLMRAVSHNYPLVSGLYWAKRGHPAAWNKTSRGYEPVYPQHGAVIMVDYTGLGFTLVDCRLFNRLSKPLFVYERADDVVSIKLDDVDRMIQAIQDIKLRRSVGKEGQHSEDSYFFRKMREEIGIRPLLDTGIELYHEETIQFMPDGRVEYLKTVREPMSVDIEQRKIVGR